MSRVGRSYRQRVDWGWVPYVGRALVGNSLLSGAMKMF